jgi:hypothetical protein
MGEYDRVTWRGARMTRRQRQALIATEKAIQKRYPGFAFTVPQGSWRPQTSYSGTSHTGAAVVDLQYAGFYGEYGMSTKAERDKAKFVLHQLRETGCQAALQRGAKDKDTSGNGMVNHYHVMDLDTTGAAETVRDFQVPQYRLGYNALQAGVKDRYPYRPKPLRKWKFGN